jgi:hypothetical protein
MSGDDLREDTLAHPIRAESMPWVTVGWSEDARRRGVP